MSKNGIILVFTMLFLDYLQDIFMAYCNNKMYCNSPSYLEKQKGFYGYTIKIHSNKSSKQFSTNTCMYLIHMHVNI